MVCPTSDRMSLNAGWGKYEVSLDAVVAGSTTASAATSGSSPSQHPHPRDEILQPFSTAIYCHQQARVTYLSLSCTVCTPRLSCSMMYTTFSASLRRTKSGICSRAPERNLCLHVRHFCSLRMRIALMSACTCASLSNSSIGTCMHSPHGPPIWPN